MFECKTYLSCDICGYSYSSTGRTKDRAANRDSFRRSLKENGWKTIYGKYDVCKDCVEHYGIKECRRIFKREEVKRNETNNK